MHGYLCMTFWPVRGTHPTVDDFHGNDGKVGMALRAMRRSGLLAAIIFIRDRRSLLQEGGARSSQPGLCRYLCFQGEVGGRGSGATSRPIPTLTLPLKGRE